MKYDFSILSEPGDYAFFPFEEANNIRVHLHRYARKEGKQFVTHKCKDEGFGAQLKIEYIGPREPDMVT